MYVWFLLKLYIMHEADKIINGFPHFRVKSAKHIEHQYFKPTSREH